jgi:hypothetical protein
MKSPVIVSSTSSCSLLEVIFSFRQVAMRKGDGVGHDRRVLGLTEYHEYHLGDCG